MVERGRYIFLIGVLDMKLLITTLTMIFISFGANAVEIGKMYNNCKPFQNNGFSMNGLAEEQLITATVCGGYFRGMIDLGVKNCVFLRIFHKYKMVDDDEFKSFSKVLANTMNPNLRAVIAGFINYAENNSEKWDKEIGLISHNFLSEKFPCKLEE